MRTLHRICIKDWEVTAENGDYFKVFRGKEYLTTPTNKAGNVVVLSTFWVPIPATHFAGEQVFTEN